MKTYTLKCYLCGKEHKETESVTACLKCGGTMETYIDYENVFKGLNLYNLKATPISALKYFLPALIVLVVPEFRVWSI